MTDIKEVTDLSAIFAYMETLKFPYRYDASYDLWKKSYAHDVDGEGRILFAHLVTLGAYEDGRLVGFLQYGWTAFGFDEGGEISSSVSCPVIRNFYYEETCREAGKELLAEAMSRLSVRPGKIYAFYHYFGMSCYGRHGKLFENISYVHDLLIQARFRIEHENVFYSSESAGRDTGNSDISCIWHDRTAGDQQYCDFFLGTDRAGGCEVHFLEQQKIAYLRWIFVNDPIRGRGIGSRCMAALKSELLKKGFNRLDTDTALLNGEAQHFYEKNGFAREGLTRSYFFDKR